MKEIKDAKLKDIKVGDSVHTCLHGKTEPDLSCPHDCCHREMRMLHDDPRLGMQPYCTEFEKYI